MLITDLKNRKYDFVAGTRQSYEIVLYLPNSYSEKEDHLESPPIPGCSTFFRTDFTKDQKISSLRLSALLL